MVTKSESLAALDEAPVAGLRLGGCCGKRRKSAE
jgi:hypothetical protein